VASDSTDAFGRYHLARVSGGNYELRATHPGYTHTPTGITVTASAAHTLVMEPLPNRFDVHVQVFCALSGWLLSDCGVVLKVDNGAGVITYGQSLTTDENGYACFRGVPEGNATFACNQPGGPRRLNWEGYTRNAGWIANDKMVSIHLKPEKDNVTVDLDFTPTTPAGTAKPAPPYLQNFWIEAQGYDPANDDELYPPRTELSDYEGKVTFVDLPALPTRISVRRPGFEVATLQIAPTDGSFSSPYALPRPSIAANTTWDLAVEQELFQRLPAEASTEGGAALLRVDGIPASNTEGFKEYDRYAVSLHDTLPFRAVTDHGQMSAWGQGRYMVSPGSPGYVQPAPGFGYFLYAYDFPPQLVALVEGQENSDTIRAVVPPATFEGTLFAADAVTPRDRSSTNPWRTSRSSSSCTKPPGTCTRPAMRCSRSRPTRTATTGSRFHRDATAWRSRTCLATGAAGSHWQ
jgi:hypothetical protein